MIDMPSLTRRAHLANEARRPLPEGEATEEVNPSPAGVRGSAGEDQIWLRKFSNASLELLT